MQLGDFLYELPAERIAQRPPRERGGGRMLVVEREGGRADRLFRQLPEFLRPGDLLVCNDARVIPARLYGRKASGGRVELLVERLLDAHRVLAHLRAAKPPRPGSLLHLDGGVAVEVGERRGALFTLRFDDDRPASQLLEQIGHTPLPPYIRRADGPEDRERYQTVYANKPGAVAAPTAGLHFDRAMLERLERMGVERAALTLYVGAGTFQPVRVEQIDDHKMHSERVEVGAQVCAQIAACRARGGRVVAVGTTVVRALESAARDGALRPFCGETDLFIRPGWRFRCVDLLLTNFHLPGSTLLMLVCAFGGYETVMAAYRHAAAAEYRFFSYGDAMLIHPRLSP